MVNAAELRLAAALFGTMKAAAIDKGDWRAAKELLSRRFPADFSDPTQRLEVAGPDGGPIPVGPPELASIIDRARARAVEEGASE